MSITAFYHTSVETFAPVYREFGHTPEYKRKVADATKGSVSSGRTYDPVIEEWAVFHTRRNAEQCQKLLLDTNYYFMAKLLA